MKNVHFFLTDPVISFSRYLSFCILQLGEIPKFHDVTLCLSMKRKTHIFEYLGKGKQPDHKTWSNERISHEKYFCAKFMQKMSTGN